MKIKEKNREEFSWPAMPYKGLNYYGPEDMAIFAARDTDVGRFSSLLSSPETRVVILHGATGSGKSSFLRAGLIPLLEKVEHGYAFARSSRAGKSTALFIRSTADPMLQLSEAVYALATTPRTVTTPIGVEALDLSGAILGQDTLPAFVNYVRGDSLRLLNSLSELANVYPETLVLIIDQVEEVLTLQPGQKGNAAREIFFKFLRHFSDVPLDIKIIIAARTEYFGKFGYELRWALDNTHGISDYYLADLNEDQIVEAIERPTRGDELKNFGIPYSHYQFSFENQLPRRIARDLQNSVPVGGILPALQIVCDRLYRTNLLKGEMPFTITLQQYRRLGGIEGQIEGHLKATLERLCQLANLADTEFARESMRWQTVLLTLVKRQIDGTVTTEVVPLKDFLRSVVKAGCKVSPKLALEVLSSPSERITRSVSIYNAKRR